MRILALGLACGLAGTAAAGCLEPGQMPVKVTFADGDVKDQIVREGDILRSVTHVKGDLTATAESAWGIFPLQSSLDGYFEQFRWKTRSLPDPAAMAVGKTVKLKARRESPGGNSAFVMTVTPQGREEIAVGSCRYEALHLRVQQGTPNHVSNESEIWLDTDRLMVWASETKIYTRDGKLQAEVHDTAVAAE